MGLIPRLPRLSRPRLVTSRRGFRRPGRPRWLRAPRLPRFTLPRFTLPLPPLPRWAPLALPRLPRLALPALPVLPPPRQLPSLPLAAMLLTTGVLLVVPAALLLALPRRRATGLERLIPAAALLQSFPVQAGTVPPPLWRQRLGPVLAGRLWRGQRRLWWQFWGSHGDAGAYLVLTAPPALPLPRHGLRVDDLLVVAPDPLARQLLQDQLRVRRRPPRGLALRCDASLREGQAVFWNPGALAQLLGPLAPLAPDLQLGCLSLSGEGRELRWRGEAAASPTSLAPAATPLPRAQAPALPEEQLLELQGRRLDLLLRGPLTSPLLRRGLAEGYGLGSEPLRVLRAAPFRLLLQPLERGPFQAGLVLEIQAVGQRAPLDRWLADLRASLRDQALSEQQPEPALSRWSRADGTVVGGWRWTGPSQLQLFLGPVPAGRAALPLTPLAEADWRLRLRPAAMARLALLPAQLPAVVQRASQLELQGREQGSPAAGRETSLVGRLLVP